MSLIDNILILAEEKENFDIEEVHNINSDYSKQIIASTLGRLIAKELLIKKNINNTYKFSITKFGKDKLNSILDGIKKYSPNALDKHSWQIIIFDIPEKSRKLRDALRNSLINLGFGKIQDSIWVSYVDYEKEIQDFIKILDINDNVTIIQTAYNQNDLANKIQWNWQKINSEYKEFINLSNKFLQKKNKDSYFAKQLVYTFAKIIQHDPKLPEVLQPKNALTVKAFQMYQKIRPFCYNK